MIPMGRRALAYLQRRLLPQPVDARHGEYSMVFSEDDTPRAPNDDLVELLLHAGQRARKVDLSHLAPRLRGRFRYPDSSVDLWPGEHYRLLAALAAEVGAKHVVDIGTAEGLSALAMLTADGARVTTFDLVPWHQYPRSCLTEEDFADGRLRQVLANIGDESRFVEQLPILRSADLIFLDAAKDGILEQRIIDSIERHGLPRRPIVVFDDTRMWNMLRIWRELKWPKVDATSLGHWTGTGIARAPAPPQGDGG